MASFELVTLLFMAKTNPNRKSPLLLLAVYSVLLGLLSCRTLAEGSLCSCNGHGTLCAPDTGKCYCTTKGITGNNCERCDESNMYAGNPADNGTCFYKLVIDFQFTFNLSNPKDRYFTQINYMITPPKPDVDTDFTITCSVDASFNVAVKTGNVSKSEHVLLTNQSCKSFKYKFSHNEYPFGTDDNTTFYVYVYDFQTPMWVQVAFSQYPKLDLL